MIFKTDRQSSCLRFKTLLYAQLTGLERKQKICEFVAFGKMKKKYFLVRLLLTLFSSLLIFLFILPYLLLLFKVINIGNILGLCIGFFILFIGLFLPYLYSLSNILSAQSLKYRTGYASCICQF